VGEHGAARGAALDKGVALGGAARRPTAALRHGIGEAEEEEEGGAARAKLLTLKLQGHHCKLKFSTVLRLN
jgi:hypothetical protein